MSKVIIAHGGNIGFQGGGTNRVLNFAKVLAENGYEVGLVVPKPVGEVSKKVRTLVKLYTIPVEPKSVRDQIKRAFLVSLEAKKIAKKENAILQIEHSTLGGVAALMGCSNYVLDIHDIEFDGDLYRGIPLALKFVYYLERKSVKKALKIIVVSEEMKQFISNQWEIKEDKIEVIPNGARSEFFRFNGNEEIAGLISFLGVLTHNICYEKFIELANSSERIKIYVIGDGPMRSKFRKRLEIEKTKNIIVPGYLPDEEAYRTLAMSQVCIFPLRSTFHTKVAMHMKILDYAALGKAIATDRDATARIFEKNDAALVSDAANHNEFIENVHKLLADERLRRKLGENARKLVKDFTWERQGEKLVKMYGELI